MLLTKGDLLVYPFSKFGPFIVCFLIPRASRPMETVAVACELRIEYGAEVVKKAIRLIGWKLHFGCHVDSAWCC